MEAAAANCNSICKFSSFLASRSIRAHPRSSSTKHTKALGLQPLMKKRLTFVVRRPLVLLGLSVSDRGEVTAPAAPAPVARLCVRTKLSPVEAAVAFARRQDAHKLRSWCA